MRLNIIKKSPAEIEAMKEAGRLSAYVLRKVGEAAKPGVSTLELDELAETLIRAEGGIPAFKGYGGFPGSICASVNDQIVHGIPSSKAILREGDILSIDTGATVDGWVGDNGRIPSVKYRVMLPCCSRLLRNACGRASRLRVPAIISVTLAMPFRASPRRKDMALFAIMWAMVLAVICMKTPMCLIMGALIAA